MNLDEVIFRLTVIVIVGGFKSYSPWRRRDTEEKMILFFTP